MLLTYCAVVTPNGQFEQLHEIYFPDFDAKTTLYTKSDHYQLSSDYLKAIFKHYKKTKQKIPMPIEFETITKKFPNNQILKVHIYERKLSN